MSDVTAWRYCENCGQHKQPHEFYSINKAGQKRRAKCRVCTRYQMRVRYRERRDVIHAIKMRSGCVDCGYRDNPYALEFDHLPGVDKVANVAGMLANAKYTIEDIEAEAAKCEVVCANCHRIRTFNSGRDVPTANWDLKVKPASGVESPYEQMSLEFDSTEGHPPAVS